MRCGFRINIPAQTKPLEQTIFQAIGWTLQTVQQAIQSTINIAPKNFFPRMALPVHSPKDKEVLQLYFDHRWRATPNKEYIASMKICFVTSQPTSSLAWPLSQLGSFTSPTLLGECLDPAKYPQMTLSPRPLACQATKLSVERLFWICKVLERNLAPALRGSTYHCVPQEVSTGAVGKLFATPKRNPTMERRSESYPFKLIPRIMANKHQPLPLDLYLASSTPGW